MLTQVGENLLDTWNGPKWSELRRSFLKNEQHEACKICWRKEQKGYVSARDCSPEKVELSRCSEDGRMMDSPRSISLRLGNKCNLACVMCTPQNSSLWSQDEDIYIKHIANNVVPAQPIIDIENPEFRELLSSVESITFIGGEPLLYLEQEKIMSYLIKSGRASEVELHYYTNTTVLPDRIIAAWKSFKKIDLRSSIDGVGEHYEYIRSPAKWSVVEKNILKLNNSDLTNLEHSICFVFMNINALELEKLFRWRAAIEWKRKAPTIRPDYLVEPEFLKPNVLPPLQKEQAQNSLLRAMQFAGAEENKLILDMKDQLREEAAELPQQLTHLTSYLEAIDQRRNLNSKRLWSWLETKVKEEGPSGVASRTTSPT